MVAPSYRTTKLLSLTIVLLWSVVAGSSAGEVCDEGELSACQHSSPALIQRTQSVSQLQGTQSNFQTSRIPSVDINERYLKLVEMAVTGSLTDEAGSCDGQGCTKTKAFDAQARATGNDWPPFGHTMVGHARLQNIRAAIAETIEKNIPGDFAELGVWRGGSCIYAKALYDVAGEVSRKVHVFDVFGEVPAFGTVNLAYQQNAKFLAVSLEAVKHNFQKYGVLDDNVQFHKGLFKDTLPVFVASNPQQQISVLRIDGNFYDSYQDALYNLYPMVPVGGIVIFDDVFADPIAMDSWHDFKSDNGLLETLHVIDSCSAWFRKEADVKIDPKKQRAPRDANLIVSDSSRVTQQTQSPSSGSLSGDAVSDIAEPQSQA